MEVQKLMNEFRAVRLLSNMKSISRGLLLTCALYLVLFVAAELITYYVRDFGGIILYFAILLSLLINSTFNKDESQRKFWLALGLVPLIRIVGLLIPHAVLSRESWYILVAIPLLVGIFTVKNVLKISLKELGLNGCKPLFQILLAITGIVLGVIDYFILRPNALNRQLPLQYTLFTALVLLVATGLVEELAFRGVMQKTAVNLFSWGWVYIAGIYAVLQIGRGSVLQIIFALAVGLFWGWAVKKTGSTVGVIFSHGLLNICLYLVLPRLF